MSTTTTAIQAYNKVRESAEAIVNDKPQHFPEAASPNDYVRQGDVYIRKISKIPVSAEPEKNPQPQVAPGNTKGSRHILDSLEGVTVLRRNNPNALQGPILSITCERILTHPEHGDWHLPAGVYSIEYQRDFAEELRRVMD